MEVTKEEPWSNPLPFTGDIKIRELERAHPHEEGGKGQTWASEASTLSKFQAWGGSSEKRLTLGTLSAYQSKRKLKSASSQTHFSDQEGGEGDDKVTLTISSNEDSLTPASLQLPRTPHFPLYHPLSPALQGSTKDSSHHRRLPTRYLLSPPTQRCQLESKTV